jgi:hypothetical protein
VKEKLETIKNEALLKIGKEQPTMKALRRFGSVISAKKAR